MNAAILNAHFVVPSVHFVALNVIQDLAHFQCVYARIEISVKRSL